ncbi:MAG: hypothetical protein QM775_17070 [Pirellulales bacterium]
MKDEFVSVEHLLVGPGQDRYQGQATVEAERDRRAGDSQGAANGPRSRASTIRIPKASFRLCRSTASTWSSGLAKGSSIR